MDSHSGCHGGRVLTPARSDTIAACERQSGKEENEMKACVICAMKEEAEAVAAVLSDRKEFHWAHGDGFRGVIAGHDVTVTVSGIGKVAAAVSAVLTIKEENPDITYLTTLCEDCIKYTRSYGILVKEKYLMLEPHKQ